VLHVKGFGFDSFEFVVPSMSFSLHFSMSLFPDDTNSGDNYRFMSSLNVEGPLQYLPPQNALADDAFANASQDSLVDNLRQWQLMDTRLRRASREVPQYCRSVFTRCDGLVTRFDNLSAHELGQTQELQAFRAKFA
jgi:hypothetical protein